MKRVQIPPAMEYVVPVPRRIDDGRLIGVGISKRR